MLKHLLLGLLAAAILTAAIPETDFVVPEITGALLEIPYAESISEVQKAAPAKVTAELISSSETAHAGQKAPWGAGVMWRRRRAPRIRGGKSAAAERAARFGTHPQSVRHGR